MPQRPRRVPALVSLAAAIAAGSPLIMAGSMPDEPTVPDLPQPIIVPISGRLGLADVSVDWPAALAERARLAVVVLGRDGIEQVAPLDRGPSDRGRPHRWSARIMAGPPADGAEPPPLALRLRLFEPDGTTRDGPAITASAEPPPGHATPDWAKGAVWYQVFVERFRNGNPLNDPAAPEHFLALWNSDWKQVTADELDLARARAAELPVPQSLPASRRGGQLGNVLLSRRYGGDLEGLVEKLGELQDLGVTALYLNPVFEAPSHHKYDASDFRHIDPTFAGDGRTAGEAAALARETDDPATWTTTAADRYFFDTLMPEVRERDMRLVLDGVWNHVGVRHWAFEDVVRRGQDSRYKDWFRCTFATESDFPDWKNHPLDVSPGRLIGWKSWGGEGRNGGLPEFARDRAAGRLHPEVERHVFECTRRWTEAIDGWRLDVVPDLPMPFWRAWSDHVRSINPDAALYAEVWFDAKDYFASPDQAKIFDGQMNYPFAFPVVRWLSGEESMPAAKVAAQLRRVFTHKPQHDLVQMNLFGSHDTERLASMLANPGREYDQQGSVAANPRYDDSRPSPEIYERVALGVAIQALHLGAPMIYYGDEYGMFGGDDPHCRQPLPWPDLAPYQDPDVEANQHLRQRFREWLTLRTDEQVGPLLRYGAIRYPDSGDPDVLVIERTLNDLRLIGVFNRRPWSAEPFDAAAFRPERPLRRFPKAPSTDDDSRVPPLAAAAWLERRDPAPIATQP